MTQKEKKKEYDRKYRLANREKIAAYDLANKERKNAYNKSYQEANRAELNAKKKATREAKKDGFYTVYYLPRENYVGMTGGLDKRLVCHKYDSKRYVEDVEVMGKYKTKVEALNVEAELHSLGYLGKHTNSKQLNN